MSPCTWAVLVLAEVVDLVRAVAVEVVHIPAVQRTSTDVGNDLY
jgi:hypothetical protein